MIRQCQILSLMCMMGVLAVPAGQAEAPRLVLQITVDQLRGDMPQRIESLWSKGGFAYLFDKGIHYANAHHAHANTETIVGHTTLSTGAYPAVHGMIGNVWFDRTQGRLVYNIEDADYHLLTAGADVDDATEIDPTQRAAKTDGRSPAAIQVSTLPDELAIATRGEAKVFAVSVKDRGAVATAGHAGKAFWFSKQSGEFVTSSYYYDEYPEWVVGWNAQRKPYDYAGKSWELSHEAGRYLAGDADDRDYETNFPGYGRTFPHPYGSADDKYFTTLLTLSPAGDELTLDFAKTLLDAEQLGGDEVTDFLSVSFSSTDYVGHVFGPSSLESEDNLVRLDRTLAALLEHVDKRVGLGNTLVVLSADHGAPEVPGYLAEQDIPGGYVDFSDWPQQDVIDRLQARFGVGAELVISFFPPYVYLDHQLIAERGLDRAAVEAAITGELEKIPGVAQAIGSTEIDANRLADSALHRAVANNQHPERSGDVLVVYEPHWFVNDFDGLTVAASHGSPWTYDTFVPLVFAGAGLKAGYVSRRVETVDMATTLAAFLGIKMPSGSVGQVLPEVIKGRGK